MIMYGTDKILNVSQIMVLLNKQFSNKIGFDLEYHKAAKCFDI